jgi:geranylgeranylglycerol-phosphate geranylgeranyltransferase
VFSTNGAAALLSVATLNAASMMILVPMLAIGIMYSAPRVALMNRFLMKTLAIATFYALCALLGITSSYGIDLFIDQPFVPLYSMVLLAIMIFVSSTLNDLGDMSGDKAAGRRTVPIVSGTPATIRLLTFMAASMIVISLISIEHAGSVAVALAAVFAMLVIWRLRKLGKVLEKMDANEIRTQHKKIFPLHMLLQLLLAAGAIFLV